MIVCRGDFSRCCFRTTNRHYKLVNRPLTEVRSLSL
jgi:hypothetical protein